MDRKTVAVLLMCGLALRANSIIIENTTADEVTENTTTEDNGNTSNLTEPQLYENVYKRFENDLYDTLMARDYDFAVQRTLFLYGRGYHQVIKNVVNRMIDNGLPEIFDYAYKVTAAKAKFITQNCFPPEIKFYEDMVFSKIISYKYGMALKCGDDEDWYGDRTIYATSDTRTRFQVTWKFIPLWYGDRVYFKARPINLLAFLKLGNSRDWDRDHGAYGAKIHDTNRHLWYLKPVKYGGKLMFYIINREYDEPLKLGKSTDDDGERRAYGHSELDYNPEKFAWDIQVLN